MKIYHYIYKLIDPVTNEYYYGSRTCKCKPDLDNYMGSYISWKPEDPKRLVKIILKSNFKTRELALQAEAKIIIKNIKDYKCTNINIPGKKFHTTGLATVKDKDNNILIVKVNDPRYLNGELVGIIKGKINVKDKNGKYFQVNKDDPRYLSGKLTGHHKGLIGKLSPSSKAVLQYDLTGKYLNRFDSCKQAAEHVNRDISKISQCCKFNRFRCAGYIWFFEGTNENTINKIIKKAVRIGNNYHINIFTIRCKIENKIYKSKKCACSELKISLPTLNKRLKSDNYKNWEQI